MADSEVSALTEQTAPALDDLLYLTNAGGTIDRKIKISTLTAMQLISTSIVTGSAVASITFSSIPGTFKHLRLLVAARSTRSTLRDGFCMRFNGDTGNNYRYEDFEAIGNGPPASAGGTSQSFLFLGGIPAATGSETGAVGAIDICIPDYAATVMQKSASGICMASSDNNTSGQYGSLCGGRWASTSAITSVTILANVGNLDVGTVASLYGIVG